jgi:hypothetical protein
VAAHDAPDFVTAHTAFNSAWNVFLPQRTEEFDACRRRKQWTATNSRFSAARRLIRNIDEETLDDGGFKVILAMSGDEAIGPLDGSWRSKLF